MNAEAIAEFVEKHNVKLLTTPPEINRAFLKTWDEFAAAESAKNPFFKKVYDSQRAYAKKVVPAKRFMFPPYASRRTTTGPPSSPLIRRAASRRREGRPRPPFSFRRA